MHQKIVSLGAWHLEIKELPLMDSVSGFPKSKSAVHLVINNVPLLGALHFW